MYRGVWLCMEVYGDVQGCMVMYGVYGYVWSVWLCKEVYGDVQGSMVMYRSVWLCMEYMVLINVISDG